jgi:phenylacetate-CoA ligase
VPIRGERASGSIVPLGTFWNESAETMGARELRDLESGRLAVQIAHNYRSSPLLRAKLDAAGASPADIRTVADLAGLPFMEKHEIADSQANGALLGANQCASPADIIRIQGTGGTTGQPMRVGWTRRDVASYGEMGARALWAMGCRPDDVVFTCMNFSLYAGGLSDHLTFETLGAAAIPYGVGQTERLLRMMAGIDAPLSLWATPSYAVRLAEVAREIGIEPRSLGLVKGFFSGEAGLQVPGYRERIEDLWGMRAQDMYGTGELGLHSGECEHRSGLHFGGSGFAVLELIDPETGAVLPFTDGRQGEVVYTSIWREACPVQRLRSHDLMQVFTDPCECGRTTFRFRILGRSDDMFIVKGVNVFPLAIQATLVGLRPRVTGEFQVLLDRPPPIDYAVPVTVEVAREVPGDAHEALAGEIERRIRIEQNFASAVTLVPEGTIAGEGKTRRVVRASDGARP